MTDEKKAAGIVAAALMRTASKDLKQAAVALIQADHPDGVLAMKMKYFCDMLDGEQSRLELEASRRA